MCFLPKKERDHDYNINTVRNFIVTRQKVHSPSAPCKHETLELKEKYAHVILGLVEHNHGDWSFVSYGHVLEPRNIMETRGEMFDFNKR